MTSLTLGKTTKWPLKAIALNAIIYIWRYYSMSIDGVNSNIIVYIFPTRIFSNNFPLHVFWHCSTKWITVGWFAWFANQLSTSCCLTLFYQWITAGWFAWLLRQDSPQYPPLRHPHQTWTTPGRHWTRKLAGQGWANSMTLFWATLALWLWWARIQN